MIIDTVEPLLRQPIRGAVVRYPEDARAGSTPTASDRRTDRADLAERLTEAGWQTSTLGPVADHNDFYAEIAAGLGFPHYFGANLDALWDVLRGIRMPTAVIIEWRRFAAAEPDRADRVLTVLEQRSEVEPPFAVVLD